MTPDVSSVVDEAVNFRNCLESEPCFHTKYVQQAAEQACYRYALDLCERVLSDADNARLDGGQVAYERVMEEQVEVLRQLIAGSV